MNKPTTDASAAAGSTLAVGSALRAQALKTGQKLKQKIDDEMEKRFMEAWPSLLYLGRNFTQINVSEGDRSEAIKAAYWVTASPHEWVWTPDQQAKMARYVLWASQRIEAMQHIANGQPLLHEPNTKLTGAKRPV